jgi:hypothetical protein
MVHADEGWRRIFIGYHGRIGAQRILTIREF